MAWGNILHILGEVIVCLEDAKTFKSPKRHLGVHDGLTPNEYREKWEGIHGGAELSGRTIGTGEVERARAQGRG
ncbi:MucR family transcriptional regulator [Mesorhizobium loti]|uniref:MucR family transcriptional regulator n=1 Tax=Rhizobium loti TaxID=381 RepID=UPI003CCC8E6B